MMKMINMGEHTNVVVADCKGSGRKRAGGLAVLRRNELKVDVISKSATHIDMLVRG